MNKKEMSVQVKESQVRGTPSFLGRILTKVVYGDRLTVNGRKDAWLKVITPGPGVEGWIHSSALTTKKIVLKSGADDVKLSASSDELALAGKGFNKQVEREFRLKNPKLNFSWIDQMEQYEISTERMQQFLKEGKVSPKGGAI